MEEKILICFTFFLFIYLIYHFCCFQKKIFFDDIEGFTPDDVNNIIQPPGSNKIGSVDLDFLNKTGIKSVSNGYSEETINNLKPSNPEPTNLNTHNYIDILGDYPTDENDKYMLPTSEFGHPNNYKFTIDYSCRKTSTGMFTDCGVMPSNDAWSANPYKGLQCELHDTETPEINNNVKNNSENEYKHSDLKRGITGTGNGMLR